MWSFDGSRFTPHALLPGALIGVRSFHQDGEGRLYIGTLGAGIFVSENKRFLRVTSREGLPDDSVWAMLPDDEGHLWMSSDRGIFRLSRAELLAVARLERPGLLPDVLLQESDGMKTIECNGGGWPPGIWTRRGRLMFPTARGVVTVDPRRARLRAPAPPALVEQVLADRAVLPREVPTRVPAGARDVEVRFTGLSFVDAPSIEFQYRLEPREADWIDSGTRRWALYSQLPPGSYRFLVRARHTRGAWGEPSPAWALEVAPRWHQRPEVRLLAVALLLLAAALVFRARTRALRAQSAALEALVAQRTTELGERQRELEAANEALGRLAATDSLTGLANVRRFREVLEIEWSRCERTRLPLSLLMIDVDEFKAYNDRYGHPRGDDVLARIARAISGDVRRSADLAARYGGEEFVLLLPDTDEAGAAAVAGHLLAAVRELAIEHGASRAAPIVTVSIGRATRVPTLAERAAVLLQAADNALYQAKAGGRDRLAV